jgi:hypothetical protein
MKLDGNLKELGLSVLFAVYNTNCPLRAEEDKTMKEVDISFKTLAKGIECRLFRADGSSKNAIVDVDEMYMVRAYKHTDGEIKSKYCINVRQLRGWQFDFDANSSVWKNSVFGRERHGSEGKVNPGWCVSLLGSS